MSQVLINLIGYFLISMAIYYKREPGSKHDIELFSFDWFIIIILIITGTSLIK